MERTTSNPLDVPPVLPTAVPVARSKATGVIAWIMDEAVTIPGTKVKIGLDPILGAMDPFFPVGEAVSNSVSIISLVEALRRGLPFKAMLRITGNILTNAGVGSIPIVGTIFSVFFRSNSRNREVINAYLRESIESGRKASWWRVVPLLVFLVAFVLGALVLNMLIWAAAAAWLIKILGFDLALPWLGGAGQG